MELKHIEAMQDFTADGLCSKIKVLSFTISWDSCQQVIILFKEIVSFFTRDTLFCSHCGVSYSILMVEAPYLALKM